MIFLFLSIALVIVLVVCLCIAIKGAKFDFQNEIKYQTILIEEQLRWHEITWQNLYYNLTQTKGIRTVLMDQQSCIKCDANGKFFTIERTSNGFSLNYYAGTRHYSMTEPFKDDIWKDVAKEVAYILWSRNDVESV